MHSSTFLVPPSEPSPAVWEAPQPMKPRKKQQPNFRTQEESRGCSMQGSSLPSTLRNRGSRDRSRSSSTAGVRESFTDPSPPHSRHQQHHQDRKQLQQQQEMEEREMMMHHPGLQSQQVFQGNHIPQPSQKIHPLRSQEFHPGYPSQEGNPHPPHHHHHQPQQHHHHHQLYQRHQVYPKSSGLPEDSYVSYHIQHQHQHQHQPFYHQPYLQQQQVQQASHPHHHSVPPQQQEYHHHHPHHHPHPHPHHSQTQQHHHTGNPSLHTTVHPTTTKTPPPRVTQSRLSSLPPGLGPMHAFLIKGSKFIVDTKYVPIKLVGRGAYGMVCSAKDLEKGDRVAIKKIPNAFDDLVDGKRILREAKILRHMSHENIIGLRDLIQPPIEHDFSDIYLVFEYMDTDLHRIIYSHNRLTEEHVQYFMWQSLRALKYMHSANIFHRDLKPSNFLINKNCDLKLCDFGLARGEGALDDYELTEYVVTRWYRAPEIMCACREYTKLIDVWSLGCIMAELLNRYPLFPGEDYMQQMKLIFDLLGTPSESETEFISNPHALNWIASLPPRPAIPFSQRFPQASPVALDLLQKMLEFSPDRRISVDEALQHPYFQGYRIDPAVDICRKHVDFAWEEGIQSSEDLRQTMWQEICRYRPALRKIQPRGERLIRLPDSLPVTPGTNHGKDVRSFRAIFPPSSSSSSQGEEAAATAAGEREEEEEEEEGMNGGTAENNQPKPQLNRKHRRTQSAKQFRTSSRPQQEDGQTETLQQQQQQQQLHKTPGSRVLQFLQRKLNFPEPVLETLLGYLPIPGPCHRCGQTLELRDLVQSRFALCRVHGGLYRRSAHWEWEQENLRQQENPEQQHLLPPRTAAEELRGEQEQEKDPSPSSVLGRAEQEQEAAEREPEDHSSVRRTSSGFHSPSSSWSSSRNGAMEKRTERQTRVLQESSLEEEFSKQLQLTKTSPPVHPQPQPLPRRGTEISSFKFQIISSSSSSSSSAAGEGDAPKTGQGKDGPTAASPPPPPPGRVSVESVEELYSGRWDCCGERLATARGCRVASSHFLPGFPGEPYLLQGEEEAGEEEEEDDDVEDDEEGPEAEEGRKQILHRSLNHISSRTSPKMI